MFNNPLLEALSKSSPTITFITYGSIITTLVVLNFYYQQLTHVGIFIGIFLAGFVFWTFAEYILHRFVFHYINETKFVQRFHYSVHGYHHDYPRDETRVFMPPLPGIVLSSLFFGLYYLIMGKYGFAFAAGFISGYLTYASIHWSTHRFKPPKSKFFKLLWRHHNLHHFRHSDKAYGVSSPLWDYVFGTMPPKKEKNRNKQKLADVIASEA